MRFLDVALLLLLIAAPVTSAAQEPIVSLWYAGDGSDLAELPTLGFSAITVAASAAAAGARDLQPLAERAGLRVVVRERQETMTSISALAPGDAVDLNPELVGAEAVWPLAWRAVAHGSRVVSFVDPEGSAPVSGLMQRRPPWLVTAGGLARQFRANGALFARARPGPAVRLESPPPEQLDVVLLDAQRAWVLVATNASSARARGAARLPAQVPYAMWLNLLEGTTMAMLEQPEGPKWVFDLEGWGARIYVIDKALK